jgi:hypothetical protein
MFIARIAKRWVVSLAFCGLGLAANQAATPLQSHFLSHANIERKDGQVSVLANSPRPLDQAVAAIRRQYGWIVDYEDPPYDSHDLVDDTDPGWREAHPNAKGVTRVAGGTFTTVFSLGSDMNTLPPDRERVLDKVLADYETSGNPGVFTLTKEGADRYAVVGVGVKDSNGSEKKVAPILDNRIVLPLQERTVGDTLQLILRALSEKSEFKVVLGSAPINLILQTKVKLGGDERSARELLTQLATATRFPMVWRLLYDADPGWYFMNLEIATEATRDSSGQSR